MDDLIQKNALAADAYQSDRRGFLRHGLALTAALGFWMPAIAKAAPAATGVARIMAFTNVHTGESFRGEYWVDGRYLPDAFGEIKTVLRDYRNNQKFPIDPRLMDVLYVLQRRLENKTPYEIFSGYRSPQTNAWLRRHTDGVARGSLHMQGQAIDLHQPGTPLAHLDRAAINLKAGGVGYYPSSDFVHIDTGSVRTW